ncbi:MAG: hypothetical protein ACRCZV_12725 [Sediminibacterium sp.]
MGCKKNQIVLAPPLAPSNVSASLNNINTITVTWTDNADNETAYVVNRVVNYTSRVPFVLPANSTQFIDTVDSPQLPYSYEVAAKNSAGFSAFVSTSNSITPINLPPIITAFDLASIVYPDSIIVSSSLSYTRDTAAICGYYWMNQNSPNIGLLSETINDGITAKPYKNSQRFTVSIPTKPGTTYKIVAYAKNRGLITTETKTLTTPNRSAPIISANPSFANYGTDATILLDSISSDGFSNITERGIVWSLSPNPMLPVNSISTNTFKSATSIKLPSFPLSTTVYIREYATNSIGTSYGPQAILRTPVPLSTANIGDVYDGGVIFYLLKPGDPGYDPTTKHGFIVAIPISKLPRYGSVSSWGLTTPVIGTDTSLFTGENNTLLIASVPNSSAFLAVTFIKNTNYWPSGNWFLPSKAELSLMVSNLTTINSFYFDLLANSFNCSASYSSSEVIGNRDFVWFLTFGRTDPNAGWYQISKQKSFLSTFSIPIKRF